jgi:hypothetical protein
MKVGKTINYGNQGERYVQDFVDDIAERHEDILIDEQPGQNVRAADYYKENQGNLTQRPELIAGRNKGWDGCFGIAVFHLF